MYACVAICGTGFLFMRISPWRSSLLLSLPSIPQTRDCLPRFQRTPLPRDKRRGRLLLSRALEYTSVVCIHHFYREPAITERILLSSSIPNILPPVSIPTTTALHFVLFFIELTDDDKVYNFINYLGENTSRTFIIKINYLFF